MSNWISRTRLFAIASVVLCVVPTIQTGGAQVRIETPAPYNPITPPIAAPAPPLTLPSAAPDLPPTTSIDAGPILNPDSTVTYSGATGNSDVTNAETMHEEVQDDLDQWVSEKVSRLPVFDKARRTR